MLSISIISNYSVPVVPYLLFHRIKIAMKFTVFYCQKMGKKFQMQHIAYFFAIIFCIFCWLPAKGEPHVRIYDCGVLLENLHQCLREFAEGFLVAFCHLNKKNCVNSSIYIIQCIPVLRIQIFFHPDPNFFHPGSASKKKNILTQRIVSKLSEIWSGLFIPDPDPDFFTHPGSRIQESKGTGSRIRIRNTDAYVQ